ncbi:polysaccharide deacetylase family protein [Streptomyces poonensis]|uniref:Hydrolase n=1 Tax=Streptomyces poonensis TaxID=68255 RepID=A0A918PB47_9ACTN|nr:polysaccharide deacetylase family protein [Streptomyces poonensis]GGY97333.1 hydrolase [Streptomyces poonensis]
MARDTRAAALRALSSQVAWSIVRRAEALRTGKAGRDGRGPLLAHGPVFRVPRADAVVRAVPGREPGTPVGAGEPWDVAAPVALTVDDGPDPTWTPALLDVLAAQGVRATFFVVGERARQHPELLRRVLADGHHLGNHSYSHVQPFAALPAAAVAREMGETQRVVTGETGVRPTLFRAPAGGWSRSVLAASRHHGLTPVDWTVDPKDWREPPADRIAQRVARARPGDIVLCHDGGGDRSRTVQALDLALTRLRERGTLFTAL